jgi:hypothetical protein
VLHSLLFVNLPILYATRDIAAGQGKSVPACSDALTALAELLLDYILDGGEAPDPAADPDDFAAE